MRRRRPFLAALIAAAMAGGAAGAQLAKADDAAAKPAEAVAAEAPFLSENNAAMDRMMAAMEVKPSGDIDADFVAMMSPHHQGAIDMAIAYLRYGKNEQLRRLAQEIIVEQQQEIAAMQLALGKPAPASVPAPTQPSAPALTVPAASAAGHHHDHSGAISPSPQK
ncbi:DUF305 domain-containing protein [Bosea sp. LjRoot9]|uniref:DUF305 domain-containing protein n=1 Tax=Bosea sp. LjRoot9 TaxID=3342341 RepID=UPI003F4F46A4